MRRLWTYLGRVLLGLAALLAVLVYGLTPWLLVGAVLLLVLL